ncbi:MAG: ThiF family adenylyltransferase, partial [Pseudomonadota bacterium]
TVALAPFLVRQTALGLSFENVHRHPTVFPGFSDFHFKRDRLLLPMVRGWIEAEVFHGSAVMLPDGELFGRILDPDGLFRDISTISVAGDDIDFWYPNSGTDTLPSFTASHAQAFDEGTIQRMQKMTFGVIGASGTGSPTIEQLLRLGAGEIIAIDDDVAEDRNINRILNSSLQDAEAQRAKVDILADAAARTGLPTKFTAVAKSLWDPEVIHLIAQCDVVFGCMDTVDGRYLLNMLATHYLIPYFDVGVRLDAVRNGPDKGQITEACGTVNYVQPGRSSLISRGLFSMSDVSAASLRRLDPGAHDRQVQDGYIRGIAGHRPAVISVNLLGSSLAVNEFLARLHPYREEPNSAYAALTFSLASAEMFPEPETGVCEVFLPFVGHGDTEPLLGQLEFSKTAKR